MVTVENKTVLYLTIVLGIPLQPIVFFLCTLFKLPVSLPLFPAAKISTSVHVSLYATEIYIVKWLSECMRTRDRYQYSIQYQILLLNERKVFYGESSVLCHIFKN